MIKKKSHRKEQFHCLDYFTENLRLKKQQLNSLSTKPTTKNNVYPFFFNNLTKKVIFWTI